MLSKYANAPVHVAYCRARPKVSGEATNQEAGRSGPQYGLENPVERDEERDKSILSEAMKHQMKLTIQRLAAAEGKPREEISFAQVSNLAKIEMLR